MAPMMTDPYWFLAKGAEKFKFNLRDLERAEENAQHTRSAGFGGSRRWLWTTLLFVAAVVGLYVLYHLTGAADVTLSTP